MSAADDQVSQMLIDLERELPVTLSAREACKALHCSRRTLSRLMQLKQIRYVRMESAGSSPVIIPRSEVLRLLAQRIA